MNNRPTSPPPAATQQPATTPRVSPTDDADPVNPIIHAGEPPRLPILTHVSFNDAFKKFARDNGWGPIPKPTPPVFDQAAQDLARRHGLERRATPYGIEVAMMEKVLR